MEQISAIIVAAKKGLRHNIMKPLLVLNGSTVIKTTVETLHSGGCTQVIVISGRNSSDLIHHLGRKQVNHLINEDCKMTDMLYSAQIGMAAVGKDVGYVFFLPADVPLMDPRSISTMIDYMITHQSCSVLLPVWQGKSGHPVLMRREVLPYILSYNGEGGMIGALTNWPGGYEQIELNDEGLYLDVDKKEDYLLFSAYAEQQVKKKPLSCRTDIILSRDKPFFNDQLAQLLRMTEDLHSLSAACRNMGISYSNGWKSIRGAEMQLGFTLLTSSRGGQQGGISQLTEEALSLLERYENVRDEITRICRLGMKEYCDPDEHSIEK